MASRDHYGGLAEVEPLWSPLGHLGPRAAVGGEVELAAPALDLAAVDVEPPASSRGIAATVRGSATSAGCHLERAGGDVHPVSLSVVLPVQVRETVQPVCSVRPSMSRKLGNWMGNAL